MIIPRWFLALVAGAIVLVMLVVGRPLLIPVAVALILFNLLTALINHIARVRLGGWSIPRPLAVAIGLAVIVYLPFLITSVLSSQIDAVVAASPRYVARVQSLVTAAGEYFGRNLADDLRTALTDINVGARIPELLGSAGATLTSITLIVLYVAFMFVESGAFHAKFERLFPDRERAAKVHAVVDSISRSVQRYSRSNCSSAR